MGKAADVLNNHLKRRAKDLGLTTRKPVWLDRVGCPDWLVFWGDCPMDRPRAGFIEIKSENDRDRPGQPQERAALTRAGFPVFRCTTTQEIDNALTAIRG